MEKEAPEEAHEEAHRNSFKAKLALFFGYNGENYRGMQFQRNHEGFSTVENTLHDILFKEHFILESNTNNLQRIKWSRAARTDKKVHALCNAISAKLEIDKKYMKPEDRDNVPMSVLMAPCTKYHLIDYDRIIGELNSVLPPDMRLFAIKKVTRNFDIRHDAKCRRYNYLLPTFVFQDWKDIQDSVPQTPEQIRRLVETLNETVNKHYLKTHNFHNFTRRLKETDPRCHRFMIAMKAELADPALVASYCAANKIQNARNVQFIRFELLGQSFVYHQIRKMIGFLVQMRVQNLEEHAFEKAFSM